MVLQTPHFLGIEKQDFTDNTLDSALISFFFFFTCTVSQTQPPRHTFTLQVSRDEWKSRWAQQSLQQRLGRRDGLTGERGTTFEKGLWVWKGAGTRQGKINRAKGRDAARKQRWMERDKLGQINTPRQIRSQWKAKAPHQSHKTDTYEREADRKRSDARVSQLKSLWLQKAENVNFFSL